VPQFLDRWLDWFRTRPADTRALIILAAIVAAVIASPVLRWVAIASLIAVVVALIARTAQRSPVRHLVIAAGALLVAFFIFDAVASAVYGPSGRGTQEEAQQAEPTTVVPVETPEPAEPTPEPQVLTVPDVVAELEQRGLACEGLGSLTRCTEGEASPGGDGYLVLAWPASDEGTVDHMQANVYGYSSTDAAFLGDVAALLIREGAEPEAARSWVEAHVEDAVSNPTSKTITALSPITKRSAVSSRSEAKAIVSRDMPADLDASQ
jgi:hypothetical protein